ncbi:shikimate dehydrogenase [Desulfuromonas acetoxidans]|uniref:Shikimate dehydrogenase (NADP(+)) n=1 Tax=Desulfuromonas acetoxidans (strain DSM 684 / 11070) TaxID=281689 RepID=Q1K2V8_DESA6|nr:shikimate dehydrogenase [Desulfuromonas acetoxidans]EAT16773.1 shikimate 5-dehydrogenase [Desulfuromonas acetoxidans DSM 684]MBF0644679.1 shikimate dehydrogenase [Desulfuromonas acetoxidans]NVD23714.1 shikimate dehydrogenase [Desulfuromonas acetoxidans]NVE15889.1 shikimate dehydrogenase [Desulfuromonas acetoxidans]
MTVSGETKIYGILGDPVQHSLSPVMQNAAFTALGLDAVYVPFHVVPNDLEDAVAGLKALQVQGVNVTVPHKEMVCAFMDRLDDEAALIGAVNTVVREGSEFVGYNTDGLGLVDSLKADLNIDVCQKNVMVLGAGGAARSAIVALARQGVRKLTIANRTVDRAQQLVERYQPSFPDVDFLVSSLTCEALTSVVSETDLIVNSTSLGLSGESFNVLPWHVVGRPCYIYDMIYSAQGTPLVLAARERGYRCCDGLGMLIAQGEAAFRLWTGKDPGRAMAQALR